MIRPVGRRSLHEVHAAWRVWSDMNHAIVYRYVTIRLSVFAIIFGVIFLGMHLMLGTAEMERKPFQRITLQPGESRKIRIPIGFAQLKGRHNGAPGARRSLWRGLLLRGVEQGFSAEDGQ